MAIKVFQGVVEAKCVVALSGRKTQELGKVKLKQVLNVVAFFLSAFFLPLSYIIKFHLSSIILLTSGFGLKWFLSLSYSCLSSALAVEVREFCHITSNFSSLACQTVTRSQHRALSYS